MPLGDTLKTAGPQFRLDIHTLPNQPQCPPELLKGIDQFNCGEFFLCHETLESLWKTQSEPERQFTQGIIQIAVGYYHLERGNHPGACKLFRRGLERIQRYEPAYRGINVAALASAVALDLERIAATPAAQSIGLESPKIQFLSPESKT